MYLPYKEGNYISYCKSRKQVSNHFGANIFIQYVGVLEEGAVQQPDCGRTRVQVVKRMSEPDIWLAIEQGVRAFWLGGKSNQHWRKRAVFAVQYANTRIEAHP